MLLEDRISKCIEDKGIALTVISRRTGIPYAALYNSLRNRSLKREIRGRELVKLCKFLDVDPMDFAEDASIEGR